ncbi:MSMEG_1061 family FMN-dependent PPOX-type flavoprotein [Pendulispora albinea]|uniref:Pyridoxamine 5'-phosphate oxidase family protein n=1 Tax=Pendulispora albinea TaxID=2741071 RepID=A0ABZ2LV70_9BACT
MPIVGPSDLDSLYVPPAEAIQKAVLPHLVSFHVAYLKMATFFCLATGRDHGLDASPRGGPPGFVHVLDPHTVAFADWPGNNRIESLRNLMEDSRVAMLFLFPGLEIFMRINGHAHVSTDAELVARMHEAGKKPKAVTVVRIDEVLFHCGKAINRARLWESQSHLDRRSLPTVGQMKAAMTGGGEDEARLMDAHYDRGVRSDLY